MLTGYFTIVVAILVTLLIFGVAFTFARRRDGKRYGMDLTKLNNIPFRATIRSDIDELKASIEELRKEIVELRQDLRNR